MSRLLAAFCAACLTLLGQIPAQDSRNFNLPNTDTHFRARTFKTLAEWEARKLELRTQILSAAGLLPLFPKNDLNPQIFGPGFDCSSLERIGIAKGGPLY